MFVFVFVCYCVICCVYPMRMFMLCMREYICKCVFALSVCCFVYVVCVVYLHCLFRVLFVCNVLRVLCVDV